MEAHDQPDRDQPDRDQPDRDQPDPATREASVGLDIATIALLIFFVALIGIVAALLLLPILAG